MNELQLAILFPLKGDARWNRKCRDSGKKNDKCQAVATRNLPGAEKQQACRQVQKSPENIHRG